MLNGVSTSPMLRSAYAFVERGWHIFPCHSAVEGRCSCDREGCKNVGKHPRTQNGLKDATLDRIVIERWWHVNGKVPSNIAIATGEVSGLVVIDVDPRHGGNESLSALEEELGPLPRVKTVRTGGNGCHIYMRYPEGQSVGSRNGWRPGVDVKSDGGYVIAPPSVHEQGTKYCWLTQSNSELPDIPEAWLAAICDRERRTSSSPTAASDAHALLLQRAQQYAASTPGAAEGGRNSAAFRLAGHIAAFVAGSGERLNEAEILSITQSWNSRCNPPLDDVELKTCVASALTNGSPRADKEVLSISRPEHDGDAEDSPTAEQPAEEPRKSQATLLVELSAEAYLFCDRDGEAFARFPVGADDDLHWQVARIRARAFKRWLVERFYREHGKVPGARGQQDALGVIEAHAVFDGRKHDVFLRVAHQDERIYFDLCNDLWQVIEIDRVGWRILDDSPVMFRRSPAMLPVPMPARGGNLDELRLLANATDEDWPLVVAWLVSVMRPTGPYPVLAVHGEHGSGKSGLCRRLRSIVDPNSAPLRADYREPRDLMIGASSGWVMALDNLSNIPAWLSDCFCRLATGGGFSCRTLYTDDEEMIFSAQRPLILNCIEEVVTRSDLLDRSLLINLPRIDKTSRRTEKQLEREFDAARPRIFGGLLNAVVMALRNEDSVHLPHLPRMADFAIWATAAESALGLAPGEFISTYEANRAAGNDTAIDASPVGKAILEFVAEVRSWSGTATKLLEELDSRADDKTKRLKNWPSGSRALGGAVKRLAPNLREAGLGVEFDRAGKKRTRLIELTRSGGQEGNSASALSASSATECSSAKQQHLADDVADANPLPDERGLESSSATDASIPDESGTADIADGADANIPIQSHEQQWMEV